MSVFLPFSLIFPTEGTKKNFFFHNPFYYITLYIPHILVVNTVLNFESQVIISNSPTLSGLCKSHIHQVYSWYIFKPMWRKLFGGEPKMKPNLEFTSIKVKLGWITCLFTY